MATYLAFTDDFNRADGPIDPQNDNWDTMVGYSECTITDNAVQGVKPADSNHRRSYVRGSDQGRGQFAAVTIKELPASAENNSPNIHMSADESRYELTLNDTSWGIWKVSPDGSRGFLIDPADSTFGPQVGERWGIGSQEPPGDVIYVTRDTGGDDQIIGGIADTELSGGFCGINQYLPNGGSGAIDNWESGYVRSGIAITDVNGDNTIQSNGPIVITGSSLDLIDPTLIRLGDGVGADDTYLTVSLQDYNRIECEPFDMHGTKFSPASAGLQVVLRETGTSNDFSMPVSLLVEDGQSYVVVTSVDSVTPGLLNTTLIPALPGDIYEGPTTVGGQNVTLRADGPHSNVNPAPDHGSAATAWFYSTPNKDWEEITETWNLTTGGLSPTWNAIPNPTPCIVGVQYDYIIGALVSGQRPMTFTSVGDPLPAGLSIDDTTPHQEKITGVSTEAGEFTGLIVEADNGL